MPQKKLVSPQDTDGTEQMSRARNGNGNGNGERSGQKLGCVSAGLTTRWTHAAASGDDGDAHGWDGYKARASYFLGLHGTHGRPRTRNYYTAARNDLARCLWVNTAAGAYSPSEVTCFLS